MARPRKASNNNNDKTRKKVVYKEIKGKVYPTKNPDMSGVKYNAEQLSYRGLFSQAVAFAQSVLKDPVKLKEYKKRIRNDKRYRESSVYHQAIKDFMKSAVREGYSKETFTALEKYKQIYQLNHRQELAISHLINQKILTNRIYQDLNKVSKPTATRDLKNLVQQGILLLQSRGAGAVYTFKRSSSSGTNPSINV